jgi:hypothetical protein
MASKVLTIVPLLALSGLFFAAGIVEGGVLFLVFAAVMTWAFLRGREPVTPLSADQASQIAARTEQPPGGPGHVV